jgi:hypothetical protein
MNVLKENILAKIKSGEVDMKPKWYFVGKTLLNLTGIAVLLMLAVYFLSFILFILRETGVMFVPGMGMHGFVYFVTASPWLLILLVGVFLGVLYVLVTKFSFSYRRPLVYSLIGIVLFVIAVSSLLHQMGMHPRLQNFVERHEVPGMMPMYRQSSDRREEITFGQIQRVEETYFLLLSPDADEFQVQLREDTRIAPDLELVPGASVVVFGDREGMVITAFGIKPLPADMNSPRLERGKRKEVGS